MSETNNTEARTAERTVEVRLQLREAWAELGTHQDVGDAVQLSIEDIAGVLWLQAPARVLVERVGEHLSRRRAPTRLHRCGRVEDLSGGLKAEVFSDQVCQRCGHPPCPCCGDWCDVLVGDDPEPCCEGECQYAAEPKLYDQRGEPWGRRLGAA
jgi:hypothetical protein